MEDAKIKEPETIVVNIDENYGDSCITDAVNTSSSESRKPEGYVEIYSVDKDGNKQQVGKKNLVLYAGREWLASRLCNVENTGIVGVLPTEYISWFGLGNQGCPIDDPLSPTAPQNHTAGLSNEIPMNIDNTTCADLRTGTVPGYYKKPFDSIEFQRDSANANKWLILKITTTIDTYDADGYNLNEAGLFVSESNAGGHAGPFHIFSMVTFPSIVKDLSRQLVFYWYLYC